MWKLVINGFFNCFNILNAGISLAILAPFYPNEAKSRGITVTQTGGVLGSVFLTNVLGE